MTAEDHAQWLWHKRGPASSLSDNSKGAPQVGTKNGICQIHLFVHKNGVLALPEDFMRHDINGHQKVPWPAVTSLCRGTFALKLKSGSSRRTCTTPLVSESAATSPEALTELPMTGSIATLMAAKNAVDVLHDVLSQD